MEEKIIINIAKELKVLDEQFKILKNDFYASAKCQDSYYDEVFEKHRDSKVKIELLLKLLME